MREIFVFKGGKMLKAVTSGSGETLYLVPTSGSDDQYPSMAIQTEAEASVYREGAGAAELRAMWAEQVAAREAALRAGSAAVAASAKAQQ